MPIENPELESSSEKSEKSNNPLTKSANVLLFGGDLDKQALDGSFSLSSDQDSTGGEEEEMTGKKVF